MIQQDPVAEEDWTAFTKGATVAQIKGTGYALPLAFTARFQAQSSGKCRIRLGGNPCSASRSVGMTHRKNSLKESGVFRTMHATEATHKYVLWHVSVAVWFLIICCL